MAHRDSKAYHREHALHNNEALKHMDKKPDYLDWVVTICFYTALHCIKYKAFPMDIIGSGGKAETIKNFESYCTAFYKSKSDAHAKLSDLVNSYHLDISAEYSQLKDLCWNARYYDYHCDRDTSNLAKKHKDKILEYCLD